MRMPDHIIAASAQTADRVRVVSRADMPITVVPNGIDIEAIRNVSPRPGRHRHRRGGPHDGA